MPLAPVSRLLFECLDEPGLALGCANPKPSAIRQHRPNVPNLSWQDSTRQKLVKWKRTEIAQSIEGILFKMSTYCGLVATLAAYVEQP